MPRTETIDRRLKCKIHWFVSDIELIPGPSADPWKWSDVFRARYGAGAADASIGVKLRDAGLLVKTESGRYRTTENLAEYMQEEHGVDMSRPVFGLTTSSEPSPTPASQNPSTTQTTNHQSKIGEYTDTPESGASGLRKDER